ncbi:MAG: hypothetical protein JO370_12325 [Paucibacter sp.]|nr:hypothetical protein [Roseateles sp.]
MAMVNGGLYLFSPDELLNEGHSIPGFIDEQGIRDLLWIQENLGSKLYIAAGRCPNCGEKQITMYMNMQYTNCLHCGFQLSLQPKTIQEKAIFAQENFHTKKKKHKRIDNSYEEDEIVEDQYEITEINPRLADVMMCIWNVQFKRNPSAVWPVIYNNSLYKRKLLKIKRLWKTLLKLIHEMMKMK